MDIKKLVDDQTTKLLESGELEKLITENVEASIKKVIADKFGSYSFQRDIEKKMSEEIEPILEDISFSGYRDIMIDRIKSVLTGIVDGDLIEKAEKAYKDIFIPSTEPLKLSVLFEKIRKYYLDEDGGFYDEYFGVSIECDRDDGDFQWYTIKFTESFDDTNYGNEFRMLSYKSELFEIKSLKTQNLSYEKDNKSLLKVTHLTDFERILLNAYINDQKIEMDINEDDIDKSKWDGDY